MEEYRVILINLDGFNERFNFVKKQLDEQGIEFERFSAINGKEYIKENGLYGGRSEYDERLIDELQKPRMFAGEIGCALSHKRCYEKFLTEDKYKNTRYLLILEDDIQIPKNFKNVLADICKENTKKNKFNIIQLHYFFAKNIKEVLKTSYSGIINHRFKNTQGIVSFFKKVFFVMVIPVIRVLWFIYWKYIKNKNTHIRQQLFNKGVGSTAAYLIDKKAAQVFLDNTEKIIALADWLFGEKDCIRRLKFSAYYPVLVEAGKLPSSIDEIEERVR